MADHRIGSSTGTVTDVFDPARPPVLTVDPGDSVEVSSLDCSGHTERSRVPGEQPPRLLEGHRGHCLVGPVEVRGARPGDVLSVRVDALRPDAWGWTAAATRPTALTERLGLKGTEAAWLLWDLDADAGTGTNQYGQSVDLAPFLGVIGMPPAEPGEHSTVPPRPTGGNIDCRELVAGSTLFLPVAVPGAMLCVGDGHAAQGDGEVSGTAIECGMTSRLTLGIAADPPLRTAHAVTPAGRVTFGFDADLNEASAQALDAMLTWMCALYGMERAAAFALASTAVDLRVTQIANITWGVHAVLRHGVVRGGAQTA